MNFEKIHIKQLETSKILVFVADNSDIGVHRAGYNGIASLIPKDLGNNIFVPEYSGLNYEITEFKGFDQDEEQMFEPRRSPMQITYSDNSTVTLHQPTTAYKGIEAVITFRVEEPYYIHQNIKLVFHKKPKDKLDFSALFASYLHAPPNKHLYLKVKEGNSKLDGWIGVTKEFHRAPYYIAHSLPECELTAQEHIDLIKSASTLQQYESIDGPLPFYYALYYEYAFIMMFKEPEKVRLAYSPNGGDVTSPWNPAWDYVLVQDDIEQDTPYEWDLCLAFKPYNGRMDILDEVARYHQKKCNNH